MGERDGNWGWEEIDLLFIKGYVFDNELNIFKNNESSLI